MTGIAGGNGQVADDDPRRWIYPEAIMSGDTSVLAQILAEQRANSAQMTELLARTAVVEQLLRELAAKDADHEDRIRGLLASHSAMERALGTLATAKDLHAVDDRIDAMLPRVDYEADRANRTRRMLWLLGLGIPTLVAIIVPLEAVVLSRLFG